MGKLKNLKEAIKNPPPERLAKIEYQSNFLQMIGVTIVSIILIYKGLWYIIFAFIFSLGISYSQGMNAYRKYKNIMEFLPKEKPEDFLKDISPTRRRGKIIEYVFGNKARWFSIIFSVVTSYFIIGTKFQWWLRSILYPLFIMVIFLVLHFIIIYKIALPFYKRKLKGGKTK